MPDHAEITARLADGTARAAALAHHQPGRGSGRETGGHATFGLVCKYDGPDADRRAAAGLLPDGWAESLGNLETTAGLTRLVSLLAGAGGQAMTGTATRIGVGNGTTAAAVGDTDLSALAGATNRQFEVMAATYPTVAGAVATFRAVFATGEANFAWNEWGLDIGTPTVVAGTTVNATLFNHKVVSLGTKTSASAWTFTVTVTQS